MFNTSYNSSEDMINKIQSLKGKTKLKFYQNISNFYDEMTYARRSGTFQFQKDVSTEGAQGISKKDHKVIVLVNFFQTKPQVRNMNNNYYDLYYTVIKTKIIRKLKTMNIKIMKTIILKVMIFLPLIIKLELNLRKQYSV